MFKHLQQILIYFFCLDMLVTNAYANAWTLKKHKVFVSVDYSVNNYWLTTSSPKANSKEYLKNTTSLYGGYGLNDYIDIGFNLNHERITVGKEYANLDYTKTGRANQSFNTSTLALWLKLGLWNNENNAKSIPQAWSLIFSTQNLLTSVSRADFYKAEQLNYRNIRPVTEVTLSYGLKFNNQRKLKINNLKIPYSGEYNFFSSSLTYSYIANSFYDEITWHNSVGMRMHNFALLMVETFTTIPIYAIGGNRDNYHDYYHRYYGSMNQVDTPINYKHHGRVTRKNSHAYYLKDKYTNQLKSFSEYDVVNNGTKVVLSSITTFSERTSFKFSYTYNISGKDQDIQTFDIGIWLMW